MTHTDTIADTLLGVLGHFDTLLGLGVLGHDYSDAGHGGGEEFPTKETDDAKMSKQVLVHLFDLRYSFETGQNQASSSSHLSAL